MLWVREEKGRKRNENRKEKGSEAREDSCARTRKEMTREVRINGKERKGKEENEVIERVKGVETN